MCAIFGAISYSFSAPNAVLRANATLSHIYNASSARGRDGVGFTWKGDLWEGTPSTGDKRELDGAYRTNNLEQYRTQFVPFALEKFSLIGNFRAEPTTEFVSTKLETDQQPYSLRNWSIVHNGTIANDALFRTGELPTRIDSAAIVEELARQSSKGLPDDAAFECTVRSLKGSFAILAQGKRNDRLYFAANYRPLWFAVTDTGVYFASSREYFPHDCLPQMVEPYTYGHVTVSNRGQGGVFWHKTSLLATPTQPGTALVVCSGGLDSVVAATYAKKILGHALHLIHFEYGSRAQYPEVTAVKEVAAALGAKLTIMPVPIYAKSDSPLLDADSKIAGGEAGAEFAHEWVPARNLVMLSIATAFAEAQGYETIVLGNNLEEAGAYPDNEPEFIFRFNDMLPFAVGAHKRMKVIMPVGNLMKHEIVRLGHELSAPMNMTWSCYRAGDLHCGQCGPCFMRKTAFEINKLPEVIDYAV